jgi:hypothetical protein
MFMQGRYILRSSSWRGPPQEVVYGPLKLEICEILHLEFREPISLLKNPFMIPSGPSASVERIILGRFEPRLEVQIGAAATFSTGWRLPFCEYPGEWLWATSWTGLTLLLGEPKVPWK